MTNRRHIINLFFAAILLLYGCASVQKYYPAPSVMPNIERNMRVPAFWISINPNPDKIIFTAKEIRRFNRNIERNLVLTKDITQFPENISGISVKNEIKETLKGFSAKTLYWKSGEKIKKDFYSGIKQNMAPDAIPQNIEVRFALVSHFANQRLLPITDGVYSGREKLEFDLLQNNSLDIGSPVAVLAESSDRKWLYTEGPSSSGWVQAENMAFCSQKEMAKYILKMPFIVVTRPKGQIMLDPKLVKYYDYVRMGSRIPILKGSSAKTVVTVIIPIKDSSGRMAIKRVYIKRNEVNFGYLDYTPRNIILESFEMQDSSYDWGGLYGEQDCSGFIQKVFATVGINMPRNSFAQSQVGILINKFNKDTPDSKKLEILKSSAIGGLTTLYFGGHVMLYLGMIDNIPYVIHDIWAYSEKKNGSEAVRVVDRIVVSDLSLGENSKRGSLLKRLKVMRLLAKA